MLSPFLFVLTQIGYQHLYRICYLSDANTRQTFFSHTKLQDKSIHWLINVQKSNNSENINSSTYELTKSPNHKLTNSPTQQFKKLKFLSFIIQIHFNFYSVLAKKQVIKQVKSHYFQLFTPSVLSIFKNRTCILHHFAFLVWLPTLIFSTPIICFQTLKSHFLMAILPTLNHFFDGLRRFCLSLCSVYLCFSPCVQHQNALRLAPKYTAFSTKMHRVQHQNALHLAPKCTIFGCKQLQTQCKLRFYATCIHLACIYILPLFASKLTSARIDFLRQGGRLVNRKGTQNVKIYAENQTKQTIMPHTCAWPTARKARALTTASESGCRACRPRPTEAASWKRRSNLPLTTSFATYRECITPQQAIKPLIKYFKLFSIAFRPSFACLSASYLPYSHDVARYAFNTMADNMLNNKQNLSGANAQFGLNHFRQLI